jgi:dynein heavy chain 1
MQISPKIPMNLIRASRLLMCKQPAGIEANVKDSLSVLVPQDNTLPVEQTRLLFLLSFLHAILRERLWYTPTLGRKGLWEFNDSDVSLQAPLKTLFS